MNDITGRVYNCVAKSLAIQFYFRSAMTDVLSHVRNGVNEARRLFADQKGRQGFKLGYASIVTHCYFGKWITSKC